MKLEGDYLAIVTLGFGEIIRVILVNLKQITGGPNGKQFNTNLTFFDAPAFFIITAVLIVLIVLIQNFIKSTYGRAILAVREDEVAANAIVSDYDKTKDVLLGFSYDTLYVRDQESSIAATPTLQVMEVEEDSLPYPINDEIKEGIRANGIALFKIQ